MSHHTCVILYCIGKIVLSLASFDCFVWFVRLPCTFQSLFSRVNPILSVRLRPNRAKRTNRLRVALTNKHHLESFCPRIRSRRAFLAMWWLPDRKASDKAPGHEMLNNNYYTGGSKLYHRRICSCLDVFWRLPSLIFKNGKLRQCASVRPFRPASFLIDQTLVYLINETFLNGQWDTPRSSTSIRPRPPQTVVVSQASQSQMVRTVPANFIQTQPNQLGAHYLRGKSKFSSEALLVTLIVKGISQLSGLSHLQTNPPIINLGVNLGLRPQVPQARTQSHYEDLSDDDK